MEKTAFDPRSEPLVSVIIPTYNRFDSLLQCIGNVRQQTYKNIEIVVIDDCSEDYYPRSRLSGVTFLQTPQRGGAAFARNIGLTACRGDYICFLDDDDAWRKEKIMRQLDDLRSNGFHFSATEGYMVLDPDNLEASPIYHREFHRDFMLRDINTTTIPRIIDHAFLSHHNYIINSSVMISRQAFEKVGLMDHRYLKAEDWEYWLRLLSNNYPCLYIEEPMVYYNAFPRRPEWYAVT